MTAILIRIIVYVAVFAFIYFGVRRVWRDLKSQFRGTAAPPPTRVQPDLNPRQSPTPQVIDLERDKDGVYRPPSDRNGR